MSLFTVAREVGHRSTDMIEARYGHLHDRTHEGCAEIVEFRLEPHRERLGDRLRAFEARVAEETTK